VKQEFARRRGGCGREPPLDRAELPGVVERPEGAGGVIGQVEVRVAGGARDR
jgi:hypothetical protein